MKRATAPCVGNLRAVLNERPPNTTPLDIRLNEQAVQLRISIRSGLQSREAGDTTAQFQDEHIARSYLFTWQFNSIRIGEESLTVALIREGCAKLEALKCRLLRKNGVAYVGCFHIRSLNGDGNVSIVGIKSACAA